MAASTCSSSKSLTASAARALEPVCAELLGVQSLARFEICGDVTGAEFSAKISLAWLSSEEKSSRESADAAVEAALETAGQVGGVRSLSLLENAMRVPKRRDGRCDHLNRKIDISVRERF